MKKGLLITAIILFAIHILDIAAGAVNEIYQATGELRFFYGFFAGNLIAIFSNMFLIAAFICLIFYFKGKGVKKEQHNNDESSCDSKPYSNSDYYHSSNTNKQTSVSKNSVIIGALIAIVLITTFLLLLNYYL